MFLIVQVSLNRFTVYQEYFQLPIKCLANSNYISDISSRHMVTAYISHDVIAHYHSHLSGDEIGMGLSIRDCLLESPFTERDRLVRENRGGSGKFLLILCA